MRCWHVTTLTTHYPTTSMSSKLVASTSCQIWRRIARAFGFLILFVGMLVGCNQRLYRLRADKEVKYLVVQKSNDPRWDLHNFTIGMDPRSRYFDPTDPDGVPMPFDDPASHRYMHCVAAKKGYPCWHMYGDWYGLENPRWKDVLTRYNEVKEDGSVRLSMNGSVCLAQVHSSDFRTQVETIYLSALDVSTERYRFDVQFFGDSSTVYNAAGKALSPAGTQNTLTVGEPPGSPAGSPAVNSIAFNKMFATGGELVVGIANSFVWQFAGKDSNSASSLLNFAFVQPLLKGGGRVVALETLTRAERRSIVQLTRFPTLPPGLLRAGHGRQFVCRSGRRTPTHRWFFGGHGL